MASVGRRIKQLREQKGMSQGDIERSTGMLRAYISRVEHGHTVPSLGSLERFAAALDVPFYQLFREASEPRRGPVSRTSERSEEDEGFLRLLAQCVHGMTQEDRELLLAFAQKLAGRRRPKR